MKTIDRPGIIGTSKNIQKVINQITLAANSKANVLITGESGTGKEVVARNIHTQSSVNKGPFICVNCASLSESLLESELFGHIKGAFTGAIKNKIGKFEAAHTGTLFLDEIGEINHQMQIKLLRAIQERTIVRVGDNEEIRVDIRIISATNQDLREMVYKKTFREDLYYRLKVFPIHIDPLRERPTDIPVLCKHFIDKFNKETGKSIQGITAPAMQIIKEYCWAGNVRELINCLEYIYVVCNEDMVTEEHLPEELTDFTIRKRHCNLRQCRECQNKNELKKTKKIKPRNTVSRETLIEMLDTYNWNKSEVARQLNISNVALWKKMKKFKL